MKRVKNIMALLGAIVLIAGASLSFQACTNQSPLEASGIEQQPSDNLNDVLAKESGTSNYVDDEE